MAIWHSGAAAQQKYQSQLLDGFDDWSIEVMPRTAAKIENFQAILPRGKRVYIAHIDGTPIEDMIATARRLARDGFNVMPHIPARSIRNRAELADWIDRYKGEAGVEEALLLAGGAAKPRGDLHSSIDLLRSDLFSSFRRLHVAGHPEGNKDIDPGDGNANADAALKWKSDFARNIDAKMAITTQFCFHAQPVFDWIARLRQHGISLPVHVGLAGPAKLQTLIKYAMACGVGPSLRVLQKRATDLSKLLMPYEPTEILADFAAKQSDSQAGDIGSVHFFPLGGIDRCAEYATSMSGAG
jgi:methylenetetrahydrofolate reductase (NADPH)